MNQVLISGGQFLSRRIVFRATIVKPTLAVVRKTLFDWLKQDLSDMVCLDLFAGSGILGFEALSRFARSVTFVDSNHTVYKSLLANIKQLGVTNANVIFTDAIRYLTCLNSSLDLIFLDPPYTNIKLLNKCLNIMLSNKSIFIDTLVYLEHNRRYNINLHSFSVLACKRSGIVNYMLIQLDKKYYGSCY